MLLTAHKNLTSGPSIPFVVPIGSATDSNLAEQGAIAWAQEKQRRERAALQSQIELRLAQKQEQEHSQPSRSQDTPQHGQQGRLQDR